MIRRYFLRSFLLLQITPSQWCEELRNCISEHLLAPAQEGSDRGLTGREGIELAESEEGAG